MNKYAVFEKPFLFERFRCDKGRLLRWSSAATSGLSGDSVLVDRQWNWKEDRDLARRLRNSGLKRNASVEDIDYHTPVA
jgi:hypothetical protein